VAYTNEFYSKYVDSYRCFIKYQNINKIRNI